MGLENVKLNISRSSIDEYVVSIARRLRDLGCSEEFIQDAEALLRRRYALGRSS